MATQLPVGYRRSFTVTSGGIPVNVHQVTHNVTAGTPAGHAQVIAHNDGLAIVGSTAGLVTLTVGFGGQTGTAELEVVPTPLDVTFGEPEPHV